MERAYRRARYAFYTCFHILRLVRWKTGIWETVIIKSINRGTPKHRHNIRNGDRSFYQSKTWKSIRDAFLKLNPYCVECQKEGKKVMATVADHKTQRINSGSDDFSNLQGLCSSHHNAKSARERNQMYKK